MFENDINRAKELIKKIFGSNVIIEKIERMGGLSNRNYYTLTNRGEFAVRLAGFGTQFITDRKDEKISTQLANDIGIDAKLHYFDSSTGEKITSYITNSKTMNPAELRKKENIERIVQIYQKLHSCAQNTNILFNIIDTIDNYEKIIKKSEITFYKDYEEIKNFVYPHAQKQVLFKNKVPCHNDPVCENWILQNNEKMYLIDWEYGGMNNPIWDLALVSCEANFKEEHDDLLLNLYLNHSPQNKNKKELIIHKIIIDYYLSLWAKTRIPYDGEPLVQYAFEHYNRMKNNISIYKNL